MSPSLWDQSFPSCPFVYVPPLLLMLPQHSYYCSSREREEGRVLEEDPCHVVIGGLPELYEPQSAYPMYTMVD